MEIHKIYISMDIYISIILVSGVNSYFCFCSCKWHFSSAIDRYSMIHFKKYKNIYVMNVLYFIYLSPLTCMPGINRGVKINKQGGVSQLSEIRCKPVRKKVLSPFRTTGHIWQITVNIILSIIQLFFGL